MLPRYLGKTLGHKCIYYKQMCRYSADLRQAKLPAISEAEECRERERGRERGREGGRESERAGVCACVRVCVCPLENLRRVAGPVLRC